MRESESVSQSNHLSPKHRQTNIKDVGPRKEIVVYYPLPINISVILVADAAKDSGADQQNCILDVLLLMDCTMSKMLPREGGGGEAGTGRENRGGERGEALYRSIGRLLRPEEFPVPACHIRGWRGVLPCVLLSLPPRGRGCSRVGGFATVGMAVSRGGGGRSGGKQFSSLARDSFPRYRF